jgi:ribose transport system substrate-binding protein
MSKFLVISLTALGMGALAAASAVAQPKYTFALVPKSVNDIWFEQAHLGCEKAEKDLNGAIKCLYVGSNVQGGGDEQAQILLDLITKHVDGIAVSPGNAAAAAVALQGASAAGIPVLTWNSDLLPKDKGLRLAYIGTDNHAIGENVAKIVMKIKPKGGTVCIQSGGDGSAADHNERIQGMRDTLAGQPAGPASDAPGKRLTGQSGWTEAAGCPLYYNDDPNIAVQQLEDILGKYPKLDAFIGTGGAPQFQPDAYAKVMARYKDRVSSGDLAIVDTNTLPENMKALTQGFSDGQIGQHPFEMGYKVMYYLLDIKEGKAAPTDPTFTGLDICTPQNLATCIAQ